MLTLGKGASGDSQLVALGLGSNVGPCHELLSSAIRALTALLSEPRVASFYSTEAMPGPDQPRYLNTAMVGRTDLSAEALLAVAKRLEQLAGRTGGPRNHPRPLDIDLLLYGDRVSTDPELTLPHARLRDRAFVLAPLCEIAPAWELPPDGRTVAECLADLGEVSGVERLVAGRLG